MDISQVTARDIRNYLNYLRTEYKPRRITGKNDQPLSSKTIRNHYTDLSGFFTWASVEFDIPNPIKKVPAPKFTEPAVVTLSKYEIERLLKACDYCAEAETMFTLGVSPSL